MIIGLTGGMVSGKRSAAEFLLEKGFCALTFSSDVLDEELNKRGVVITRKAQQDLGNEFRNEEGAGALARRLVEKMIAGKNYVLDGVRNPGEVLGLRKQRDFVLIAIDSPQKQRFERIIARNMERDPKTWEEFLKADLRDFAEENPNGLQIAKCMEMADYTIVNDSSPEEFIKRFEEVFEKIKNNIKNYKGVVIEESLQDKSILKEVKIISTKIEKVTSKHKTPWIKQWTLHTVEIPENKALDFANKISKALDSKHSWYTDFKNNQFHFIIFRDKVFKINIFNKEEYDEAKKYGISLGIPEYQVDFHPEIKEWKR